MKIVNAEDALVIWAEYRLSRGSAGSSPKGYERPGALHGLSEEEQVKRLVEGTEGFAALERPLFARYCELSPRSAWLPGWAEAFDAFICALQERIGSGWRPVPPAPEWCPMDD